MGRYLFIAALAFLGGHLWGYTSGLLEGAQLQADAYSNPVTRFAP